MEENLRLSENSPTDFYLSGKKSTFLNFDRNRILCHYFLIRVILMDVNEGKVIFSRSRSLKNQQKGLIDRHNQFLCDAKICRRIST